MKNIYTDSRVAALLASAATGPALITNTVTVTVWWLVICPLIFYAFGKPGKEKERKEFVQFNRSPFLVCVHFLNLFAAAADFLYR